MQPHYILIPLLLVLGVVFLVYMLKRNRRPTAGGRPDRTEPPELRGPEQRKHREL